MRDGTPDPRAAKSYALARHDGQTDKLGIAYRHHLEDVANRVSSCSAVIRCTAWLHDCVEDTGATLDEIDARFGPKVRAAVGAMTKRDGEDYLRDYLPRLMRNPDAVQVKIADAAHNLGKAHLLAETNPERARAFDAKYRHVLDTLGAPSATPERLVFRDGAWHSFPA